MRILRMFSLVMMAGAGGFAGDTQHGAVVAGREGCLDCHTAAMQGSRHEPLPGSTAPDLAEKLAADYTPAALASALWNHTPAMWQNMAVNRTGQPDISPAEWQDLFIWLYSLQFSEPPADANRGKAAFTNNECATCHALKGPQRGSGKPVSAWEPLNDPVAFAWQMWNHAAAMSREFLHAKKPWPVMTGRDFKDLAAWLQYNQRGMPQEHFSLPPAGEGRAPFVEHCSECHTGPMAIENRASNQTWMDLGARLWNHAPLMKQKPLPAIPEDEFRKILAYAWERQYMGHGGNNAAGGRVFEAAGCIGCHRSPVNGAPMRPKSGGEITPWSMVALSWGSARGMHQQMIAKGTQWPRLTPEDMRDLVAYINTLPR